MLWLVAAAPAGPRWISEAVLALAEAIALHLAAVIVFRVFLKRLETPRILIELLVGAGYAAIVVGLFTRVGVNLTGLVATSAVVTAVLGFGLQDVLGNLAGGLVLEVEQAISEGDWIRTDQYFGQVRSVRVRHTALETPDGDTILVPNSAITRSPVTVLGRTMATAGAPVKHRQAGHVSASVYSQSIQRDGGCGARSDGLAHRGHRRRSTAALRHRGLSSAVRAIWRADLAAAAGHGVRRLLARP